MSGPVQVLVVGFDEPQLTGEVVGHLARLGDAGIVRLVDVMLVRREADGTFDTLDPPQGSDPDLGRVASAVLGGGTQQGEDGDEDGWTLADIVEPGSTAAVALIEHTWAGPLMEAIRAAGGRPLGETWLSPEDRARLPG